MRPTLSPCLSFGSDEAGAGAAFATDAATGFADFANGLGEPGGGIVGPRRVGVNTARVAAGAGAACRVGFDTGSRRPRESRRASPALSRDSISLRTDARACWRSPS